MPGERSRSLEIDGSDEPGLDARSIVLGGGCQEDVEALPADQPAGPSVEWSVVWEGQAQGDGTGPQKSYFVRLYVDGSATCQCPAFYFRATLRRDAQYACKHIQRARMRTARLS